MLRLKRMGEGLPGVKRGNCTLLFMPGRRGNCSFLLLCGGLEGREGCSAWFQAGHLSLVSTFFLFLGRFSLLLNGASDLSVLTDGTPCVGKSHSQRAGAFTC